MNDTPKQVSDLERQVSDLKGACASLLEGQVSLMSLTMSILLADNKDVSRLLTDISQSQKDALQYLKGAENE